jgi:predicted RNA-binding protein YlqC (UPF0109 family)
MPRFLLRSIMKAGKILENPLAMSGSYTVPNRRDAHSDFGRIVGDMGNVSQSLRSVVRKELSKYGR